MNYKFIIVFALLPLLAFGQTRSTFYGTVEEDEVCKNAAGFSSDEQVSKLISEILRHIGARNGFIVKSCPSIDNCYATKDSQGRLYILYNATFMNNIKTLRFSNADLPGRPNDWQALTVLSHELGHHLNNHITNPPPNMTSRDLELEADYQAGFLMRKLGATLAQCQSVMYSNDVSAEGSYSHPPREQRLQAIENGYNAAGPPPPPPPPNITPEMVLQNVQLRISIDESDKHGEQVAHNYYLSGPTIYLDAIKEVRYRRNHYTFPEFKTNSYQVSTDKSSNFIFSSYQWGYINDTYVKVILNDNRASNYQLFQIHYDK